MINTVFKSPTGAGSELKTELTVLPETVQLSSLFKFYFLLKNSQMEER